MARCPTCFQQLPESAIDRRSLTAYCSSCVSTSALHLLAADETAAPRPEPIPGTWLHADGSAVRIGALCRSWSVVPLTLVALGFNGMLVWIVWRKVGSITLGEVVIGAILQPIGLLFAWAAVMEWLGHVEVTLRDGRWTIFCGIGSLGVRRHVDGRAIKRIAVRRIGSGDDSRVTLIEVEADRPVRFARIMSAARRRWLVVALARERARDAQFPG